MCTLIDVVGLSILTNGDSKMKVKNAIITGIVMAMSAFGSQSAFAVQPSGVDNLVGTWVNVNPTTGNIVKMIVTNDATGFKIHTYGACTPTPCDHGEIPASSFSKAVDSTIAQSISAVYDFGFSNMQVKAQRVYDLDGGNFMEVTTQTKFAAGDMRNDYTGTELFIKQ